MKLESLYMVDIETTGVRRGKKDKILQIGALEIMKSAAGFWFPVREFEEILHYPGQPETEFAKNHMAALYERCNKAPVGFDEYFVGCEFRDWLHEKEIRKEIPKTVKQFMGWNASNFDLEFLFDFEILERSHYVLNPETGKEELKGDAHYRVYEQTGAIELLKDVTGFSRELVLKMAEEVNPVPVELPKGKEHDALYDCFKQVNMMNGLIALGRKGWRK